ncbi:hypothetical protein [Anaeromyxobacter oryzae]|uniref:Glycosyltransferase RgtA/B/C/D-like domain-containing protein n=1 Tax=Anaeromyxobacter oryzae TaxID=2918170 RepID=A0ABM7X0E9_9BACT|nr:hypothetical protein [Anaeromyxobacter oryzae]BDG05253.1 hypothetical protein AMOR_42490 [Anaeromyxobacter oryzae]
MQPRLVRERWASLVPAALVAASFATGAALSWRRLGSLVTDTGRELELPRRLLDGDVLYRDVRYFWGPLAPLVNAALYRVFGVSVDTLMWTGLAVAAAMTACLFLLARPYLGRWAAAAIAIAFVFASAFPNVEAVGVFNFVLPFNCSATYGITAAAWSLLLLDRHLRSGRLATLAASVSLAVLASFSKSEVILPVALVHLAFVVAVRPLGRARWLVYGAGAGVVAGGYAALYAIVGPELWYENLALLANPKSTYYIRLTMGLDGLGASLLDVAAAALVLGGAVALAIAASRALARGSEWRGIRKGAPLAVGAVTLAVFARARPELSMRALPVVLGAGVVVAIRRALRARSRPSPEALGAILVLLFGLACLPRIALRVGPTGYGFYLLPVALVGLGLVVQGLARAAGDTPMARDVLGGAFAGMVLGLGVASLLASWPLYREPRIPVDTPRGRMLLRDTWNSEASVLQALMRLPPSTRVMALPDGAGLVFASGVADSGDPILTYAPMALPDAAAEGRTLAAWDRDPPDVVVWQNRDTRELFGFRGFGVDYATHLREWLESRYVPLNSPSDPFVLLRRAR